MPVLSYQVNAPGYGGINPKLVYIFTDDPVSVVTTTGYIDWLANQQGIYTGDVALIVTRETPSSTFGANFYEFQRVGMGPHWNLVPESGSGLVESVNGTLNQIIASPTTGNVIVSISPDPILPGDGSVNLPVGTTAQRAGAAGSIRFNSQIPQFEVTLDGINWVALTTGGGGGAVNSVTGTTNQIITTPTTGNVVVSIDPDPILPGTASVTLPTGTTGQRGSIAGSLRMNNQLNEIELTNDGTNWYPVSTGNDTVNSVTGTANRITVTGTNNVVVDIASNYAGQTSINTLGTVVTGTWNATAITVPFGGTGATSFTAYAPVCGGTTSTGALQSADNGFSNSGRVLTSTGASSLPTWQVVPFPQGLVVSVTLAPADIRAMYGTPFLIIAGQGANTLLVPLQVVYEYIGNTSGFGGGSATGAVIQYSNTIHGAGTLITSMYANPFVGTTSQVAIDGVWNNSSGFPFTGGVSGAVINQGIYVSNTTAAYTGGDCSLRITLYYTILGTVL